MAPLFQPTPAPSGRAPFAAITRAPTQTSQEVPLSFVTSQELIGLNNTEFDAQCRSVFMVGIINALNQDLRKSYMKIHTANVELVDVTDFSRRKLLSSLSSLGKAERVLGSSSKIIVKYRSTLVPLTNVADQTAYNAATEIVTDEVNITMSIRAAAKQNNVALMETVQALPAKAEPMLVLYPTAQPTSTQGNLEVLTVTNAEGVIIGASIGALGMVICLGVFSFIWYKRYGQYMALFGVNRKTEIAESVDNPMFFDPSNGDGSDEFDIDSYRKHNADSLRSSDGGFDYGDSLGDLTSGSDNPIFGHTTLTGTGSRETDSRNTREIAMVDLDVITSPVAGDTEVDDIPGLSPLSGFGGNNGASSAGSTPTFQPKRLPTVKTGDSERTECSNNSRFDAFSAEAYDDGSDSGESIDLQDL